MGSPEYTRPKPTPFSKSVFDEYVAWFNSVTFNNDDETIATLREIMSESTIRLNDLLNEKKEKLDAE